MIGDRETRVDRGSSKVQGTVTKGTYFILIQRGQGQCAKAGVGKEEPSGCMSQSVMPAIWGGVQTLQENLRTKFGLEKNWNEKKVAPTMKIDSRDTR